MRKKKYKNGFTVAEVIIAMLFIAGLAMLLTPILYKDTKNQILKTSLQKTYTQLGQTTQAISLMQARGELSPNIMTAPALGNSFIKALEKSNKLMPEKKKDDYIDSTYTKSQAIFRRKDTTVLKNGVCVTQGAVLTGTFLNGYRIGKEIIVDVNGTKGPNKIGEDIFHFSVLKDSSIIIIRPKIGENCNNGTCAAAKILGEEL